VTIVIGIMLLAASLAMGHAEYLLLNWVMFLLGSILVVIGTGKLFFLDR
jgi:hypothetical protein